MRGCGERRRRGDQEDYLAMFVSYWDAGVLGWIMGSYRIKVLRILSEVEARMVVPSGDL